MNICITDHTKAHELTQYNPSNASTYGVLMSVAARLRAKLKDIGLNETELSRRCGVPQPTINRILSGESASPRKTTLEPIARALGVTPEWLLFGGDKPSELPQDSPSEKDYALIPQFTATKSAGSGYLNDHVEIGGSLAFPREWLRRMGLKEKDLKVSHNIGEDNWPTLADGEVILIDESQVEPRDGKMYALLNADGDIVVRRMVREFTGGWLIRSDNLDKTRYPDQSVTSDGLSMIRFVGRVVWRGGGM